MFVSKKETEKFRKLLETRLGLLKTVTLPLNTKRYVQKLIKIYQNILKYAHVFVQKGTFNHTSIRLMKR